MKIITNISYPAFALFAFACFALEPQARAVVPAQTVANSEGPSQLSPTLR
jgi:hypothetical protein